MFTQGHPLDTQKQGTCVTAHWSQVTTLKSPVEQRRSQAICYGMTLLKEETACGVRTWVRKEKQRSMFCHWFCHALLACQVCVTRGFLPEWQGDRHNITAIQHTMARIPQQQQVYKHLYGKDSGLSVKYKYVSNVVRVPKHSS